MKLFFALRNLLLPVVSVGMAPFLTGNETFDPNRFETEVLVTASNDAMQFDLLPNGDIVFAEFWGPLKRWHAESGSISDLGQIPTYAKGEVGLLGMAVDKDFLYNGYIYAQFCPAEAPDTMRVSRFTANDSRRLEDTEVELLSWPYDTEHIFHMGGGLWMDGRGDLYICTGDNCHHSPGLPVDTREDWKNWDAFRSAGNSKDHRGKILRIHPESDGTYSIPDNNLFQNRTEGLPEIYVMGVRNPFRISVDDQTGTLFLGDVGPNISPKINVQPEGYDELNATSEACNFGWPSFVGPNEPLPHFNFETNEAIRYFDPQSPRNPSPRNTGIKNLPPAKPALIRYDNLKSKRFPSLGMGGRSIMAGPTYRYDENNPSTVKFPRQFDGRLFIFEWMRNWIQTVDLETEGPEITPFLPNITWRRPMDMKFGQDGALYMIEYGDQWWKNQDSRILRVVYRRGNRSPIARMEASETAGRHPLLLHFDANEASDPDGDELSLIWSVDGKAESQGATFSHTFEEPGTYEVSLTAEDPGLNSHRVTQTIHVGNARPRLNFTQPAHGSFFDWNSEINYRVNLEDSDEGEIDPALVSVQGQYFGRRSVGSEEDSFVHPGLALMRQSTCFACHLSDAPSAGPPYQAVAEKYHLDQSSHAKLAKKILSGGTGVWGELPMPPHSQHNIDQTRQMVSWIMSLIRKTENAPKLGPNGKLRTPDIAYDIWTTPTEQNEGIRTDGGVYVLTAEYTDSGSQFGPPLKGESRIILHARKKKAALFDENHGMDYVDQAYGEIGIVGHFQDRDYIIWRELNLDGINQVKVRAGSMGSQPGWIEIREGTPEGKLLSRIQVSVTGGDIEFIETPGELTGAIGLTDVCVVGRFENPEDQILGLNWIEFL